MTAPADGFAVAAPEPTTGSGPTHGAPDAEAHGARSALLEFLVVRATRNKLQRQLRRLRKPRYALALLVGLAYFWFIFFSQGQGSSDAGLTLGPGLELLVTGALAAMAVWWWVAGGHDRALAFNPAEVNYLFTAPLLRRDLIRFKILKGQIQVLFTALILALVFGRGGSLPWYVRILSLWTLFATLNLHQIAASLVHAAGGRGWAGLRRMAVPLLVFAAALMAVVGAVVAGYPTLVAAEGMAGRVEVLQALLTQPAPRAALFPLRAVVHPTFAADATAWARAMPWALLVLVLHYAWVIRMDAAFEEAAAEAGRKHASALAAARAGKAGLAHRHLARKKQAVRATRLPLAPTGAAWRALVWKNLVSFTRLFRPTTAVIVAVGVGTVAAVGSSGSSGPNPWFMAAVLFFTAAGMLILMGPFIVRVDLRQDLERLAVLKSWPVSGRALVTGEIASTVAVLTVLQVGALALGLGSLTLSSAASGWLLPALLALVAAPLVLTLVNALNVTIQNAIALLFPAWARLGREVSHGIEAMGQGILSMLGTILLLVLSLLGPAILGAVLGFPVLAAAGPIGAAVAGGVAFVAGLVIEVAWAVAALGDHFDGMDAGESGLLA